MTKYLIPGLAASLAAALLYSCGPQDKTTPDAIETRRPVLSDPMATAKTSAVYENLIDLMDKGTMFGAQIPTLYGLDI